MRIICFLLSRSLFTRLHGKSLIRGVMIFGFSSRTEVRFCQLLFVRSVLRNLRIFLACLCAPRAFPGLCTALDDDDGTFLLLRSRLCITNLAFFCIHLFIALFPGPRLSNARRFSRLSSLPPAFPVIFADGVFSVGRLRNAHLKHRR